MINLQLPRSSLFSSLSLAKIDEFFTRLQIVMDWQFGHTIFGNVLLPTLLEDGTRRKL
jgi:hypothetical protein